MPRQYLLAAASNARAARKKRTHSRSIPSPLQNHSNSVPQTRHLDETLNGTQAGDECELECGYEGGVSNSISSDDEFVLGPHWELEDGSEWDSDEELSEYDEEQMESLKTEAAELVKAVKPTPFEEISLTTGKNWRKIEANRSLGYNGQSKRTQERRQQQENLKESTRMATKTS